MAWCSTDRRKKLREKNHKEQTHLPRAWSASSCTRLDSAPTLAGTPNGYQMFCTVAEKGFFAFAWQYNTALRVK